jgi:NADPH2:quinone reductase
VPFRACRVFEAASGVETRIVSMDVEDLSPGEVLIRAHYSGINYKDALAVTGAGKILKTLPLNAGIDVAGEVETSEDERFSPGDSVVANGMGLGESHDGGFAEYVRIPGDWLMPLPEGLSLRESMILGTAGFTAALCLERMEHNGQRPDRGPIVITGASGGVGSLATSMFAASGYEVIAVSGRPEQHPALRALGASRVCSAEDLELGTRPLGKGLFGGAVDNVGGELLAKLLPHVALSGNVACVGMAGGAELAATVFPFILRGVSLLGISSANCPMKLRRSLWQRLGSDLKPPSLDQIVSRTVALDAIVEAAGSLMQRRGHGRLLVRCSRSEAH